MSEEARDKSEKNADSRSDPNAEALPEEERDGAQQGSGGDGDKESGGKQADSEQSDEHGDPGISRSEWVVGIGSALLVLALVGFVVYEAFSGTEGPPIVTLRVERVLPAAGGYVVEVGAYNEGGSTAKTLSIKGTLKRDTMTVETSTASISYVPAETEREAGLFFSKDPRKYRLDVRPMGYDRP